MLRMLAVTWSDSDCISVASYDTIEITVNDFESGTSPIMPQGRRLLLTVFTLVIAVTLISIGAFVIGGDEGAGPVDSEHETADGASVVLEGTVELLDYERVTVEARQFWRGLTLDQVVSLGVPFTRYNRHYTRFFLKEGETAEIVLEANVPLGASLHSGHEGISIALMPGGAPYDTARVHDYVPTMETDDGGYFDRLVRVGSNWQVAWAITALESDYYWLVLTNVARQDAWCHFTVSIPSD